VSGGVLGRVFGGGNGTLEQVAGVGVFNPCNNIFISLTLVEFLNHLTNVVSLML